jgi:acyl-CoA synthetase (AMP-forming)/AMP-acid ligase II
MIGRVSRWDEASAGDAGSIAGMKTTATTAGDFVSLGARRHPDRVALRDAAGAERSYAELDRRTNRLAHFLLGLGLVKGDRVAAWMADGFEYVEVYLAAAKAGLVVCPVNARLVAAEAAHLLDDSGARVLVFTADVAGKVAELDAGVLDTVELVSVGPSALPGARDYESGLADGSAEPPSDGPEPGDLYILGYTSGTTGRPKGAMLTHAAVVSIGRQNAFSFRLYAYPEWGITGSMSFVSVVPAHVLACLRMGGTVNIMGRWGTDALLDTIRRRRLNFIYIPSPLLEDVTSAFDRDREAWLSLESVLHSASKAHPEHLEALHDVVGSRLIEGWGMTEHSGGLATATTFGDYLGAQHGDAVFGTVGRSVTDVDVRLVGPDGEPLPHDGETVGELAIASPGLMTGYWNNPDATAAALRDGWYLSGDLGSVSADGYVRISERRTDLIVSGGMNVYPSEVERTIAELAEVLEVAVVGAAHPRWGQTVVAVVVTRPGALLTEELVIEHCTKRMASFKKPARVFFVPALPRTTSLKVSRAQVREQVAALVSR